MGENCTPLLADIFLYSYETEFIQSLLSTGKKQLASRFNFTYRYIDDVLSINNPEFENYMGQMYPGELEIKDTTESNTSASNLDLLLSIERDGKLHTSIYDKRDDFNFHITNVPFLSSNLSTLFPNGLSRLGMWLNAESDDLNILSTPDMCPFFVTLLLSMNFPVSMRILL